MYIVSVASFTVGKSALVIKLDSLLSKLARLSSTFIVTSCSEISALFPPDIVTKELPLQGIMDFLFSNLPFISSISSCKILQQYVLSNIFTVVQALQSI